MALKLQDTKIGVNHYKQSKNLKIPSITTAVLADYIPTSIWVIAAVVDSKYLDKGYSQSIRWLVVANLVPRKNSNTI